jgi:hypothetical protein
LYKIAAMKIVYSILITALLLSSCLNKDDYICNTYINIDLDLSLPEYSDLTALDNSIFIEGGCAGIIIYHFATNEYKVYDRNCSYEPSLACSFIDSVNSAVAYCGCCSSAFLLSQDGAAANAPALLPLKMYNWSLTNDILRISN